MPKIETRDDVFLLVNTFYKSIRTDALLGPIFNTNIPENEWSDHIDKLTDFWMTLLFGVPLFKGNPGKKHLKVDANMNHELEQGHFEHWLYIWDNTIDELFDCNLSQNAKYAAKNIAEKQFHLILNKRQRYV